MSTEIKALLFDFGGVLVRTENDILRKDWEQKLNLTEGGLSKLVFDLQAAVQATIGLAPELAIWENVASTLGLDSEELKQLRADFWKNDYLDQDLVNYIKSVKDRFTTCIISNAWPDARELFTDHFHLGPLFDHMIISAEVGLAKPDPRIYHHAADMLHLTTGEMVFIDDNIDNVTSAKNIGIRAIQYTGTQELLKILKMMIG